jgi:predicted metal-dependent peptidase
MNEIQNIQEAGPNGNVSWMGTDGKGKKWEDYETIKCPDGQIIDMVKLIDEQYQAKAALVHIIPWFDGIINKLRVIYTFHVDTQATDGFNLFINPQYTYNLDLTGKVFVMAHELIHCLLNHMRRGKGHDSERSNIAADYEVNSYVDDIGLIKPEVMKKLGALYDKKYSGLGYETIYDMNPPGPNDSMQPDKSQQQQAQKNQQQDKGQGQGQGQSGSGSGGNQQYSEEYKKGWNKAMEDYKNGKIKL